MKLQFTVGQLALINITICTAIVAFAVVVVAASFRFINQANSTQKYLTDTNGIWLDASSLNDCSVLRSFTLHQMRSLQPQQQQQQQQWEHVQQQQQLKQRATT